MKRGDGFGCDPVIILVVLLLSSALVAAFNGFGTVLL